jgi:hypothetical protein
MKECELINDLFFKVHDNSADQKEMNSFHEHLDHCHNCREDFRWYGSTINALSSLEEVQPPPDFLPKLHQRLDQTRPSLGDFLKDLFSGAHLPAPAGAAALAVIGVTCLFLYNDGALMSHLPFVSAISAHQTPTSQGTMAARTAPIEGPRVGAYGTPHTAQSSPALNMSLNHAPASIPANSHIAKETLPMAPVAEVVGADNLTVESHSIDNAVESVKRMLPNIEGKIVVERNEEQVGEKVLRVMIPSRAYGDLTTELINHGAVASGAGSDFTPPKVAEKGRDQVLLYISFTHAR